MSDWMKRLFALSLLMVTVVGFPADGATAPPADDHGITQTAEKPTSSGTVLAQSGAAVATNLVSTLTVAGVIGSYDHFHGPADRYDVEPVLQAGSVGLGVGVMTWPGVAVAEVGRRHRGRSNIVASIGGSLVGYALAIGWVRLTVIPTMYPGVEHVAPFFVLPAASSMAAYWLFDGVGRKSSNASALDLTPSVSKTKDGMTVGFTTRF